MRSLRAAASNFSDKFAEGCDNLGLVTFASSAFVDFALGNNFKSAIPNVTTMLKGLVCNGATSSAMGLWEGYQQLATLNQPNSLNVILFFTDGQPTGVTANYTILGSSSCNSKTPKFGVFNGSTTCCSVGGLLKSSVQAQPMASDHVEIANSSGCAYDANWFPTDTNAGSMWSGGLDVSFIPPTDYLGNQTETGYQTVSNHHNGGIDASDWSSVTAAAVNSADNAGLRIRKGLAGGGALPGIPNVVIFSLGLGNAAIPASGDLLERISNDPAASNYDSTYPSGFYVSAPSSADLADAFSKIASEILRLAK